MAKQIVIPKPIKVPSNWRWIELGKLTAIKSGYPFDSKHFTKNISANTRPLIRIRDVVKGETETYTDQDCPEEYIIKQGEILIGMDGDFNVGKWQSEDALLNQRVCCIQSRSSFYLNNFLFYYLPDPLKKINDVTPSVTVKHLSTKTLAITPVPVPPLAEQQRIVDRIESLFAKLDEAKQKAQDALDGFEIRKAAILHKAFTGELTAQWRKEHGVGMESWDSITLKSIATSVKDKFNPTTQTTSLRYIGLEHIQKNQGIIGFGTADDIKSLKTVFQIGDILYGKLRPYLNKHDIAPFDGICSTDILVYRTKHYQTAKYINYFMNTEYFISTAVSNSKGINLPRVSDKEIGNIFVDIPSVKEQTEIVRILDSILAKEQQAKQAAEEVLEQIELTKKSILARAFRGELGTNDPGEESAVELVGQLVNDDLG